MPSPALAGCRVVLRPVEDADAYARRDAGNVPELSRMYGGEDKGEPYGLGRARHWAERLRAREPYGWAISLDGRAIGELFAHKFDSDAPGSCWVALGIFREDLWSQGLGGDALEAFLSWAFSEGGRSMVFLRVLEFNARAIACYERAGFRECGRQASGVPRGDGQCHADVIMLLRRCDRTG